MHVAFWLWLFDLDASDPDPLFRSAGKGSITARVQT